MDTNSEEQSSENVVQRTIIDDVNKLKSISIFTIVFIGFMQTLAIMPGVSRAGIVITAALLANFSREDSIKIAFLLSIPAIFMATISVSYTHLTLPTNREV